MRRYLAILSLLFVLIGTVTAQSVFRGGLSGMVEDPQGAVIAGAKVDATNSATGLMYSTVSSSAGAFSIADLPLGDYNVVVTFPGFASHKVDQIRISAGAIFSLTVNLSLAETSTTVEVNAAALSLDTATPARTFTLPKEEVQDVPLNGRSYTAMTAMQPGNATGSTRQLIDGVDNNDPANGGSSANQGGVGSIPGTLVPIDSIDEFSAQQQAGAESGGYSGTTVNLSIKSGGNHVHGTLYYFNRNEFFAAMGPFTKIANNNLVAAGKAPNGKSKIRFQEYGGSIGGPIVRDKYFYFLNFERQQYILGQGTTSQTEPSADYVAQAEALLATRNITPANTPAINMALALINTVWQPFMLKGPASTGNWTPTSTAQTGYSNNMMAKFDQVITPKNRISERWYWGQGSQTAPKASQNPWYYQVAGMHIHNIAFTLNSEIKSKATNQVLMGVDYFNQPFSDANPNVDVAAIGFNVGLGPGNVQGAPTFSLTGFDGAGGQSPFSSRHDFNAHASDIVSLALGRHSLRLGGEYRRTQIYEVGNGAGGNGGTRGNISFSGGRGFAAANGANGTSYPSTFVYNGVTTTVDTATKTLADFLQMESSTSTLVNGLLDRIAGLNNFNLYVQDSYQVTKNFNLNLGLRWDYLSPIGDDQRDLTVFNPKAKPSSLVPSGGLSVVGYDISEPYKASALQLAPRVGFSWQPAILPSISKGLVVRGAIGIYFDTPTTNSWLSSNGLLGNPAGTRPDYNQSLTNPNLYGLISGALVPGQTSIFPVNPILPGKCASALTTPTCPALSIAAVDNNFSTGNTTNMSANVQKALGNTVIAEVSYVGSRGRHLKNAIDVNQTSYGATTNTTTVTNGFSYQQINRPYYNQYPNFGKITQTASFGSSNANAFQALIRARGWHGLIAELSYALSTSSGTGSIEDYNNPALDYGSNSVITNMFKGYWTYSIPNLKKGPSWLVNRWVTGGWQTAGTLYIHGAPAVTASASGTCSTSGGNTYATSCSGLGVGEAGGRANLTGNPFFCSSAVTGSCKGPTAKSLTLGSNTVQSTTIQWFNPYSVISPIGCVYNNCPGPLTQYYGTTSPGQIHGGPGYGDVDFSVFKNLAIRESVKAQFRAEMFNVFNRYNYAAASLTSGNTLANTQNGGLNASTTGTVSGTTGGSGAPGIGAGEPFNIQLALKIIF